MSRSTHTYAVLDLSQAAYEEIRGKLAEAGYQHAFHDDGRRVVIDMHGIAVANGEAVPPEGHVYAALDGRDGWVMETHAGRLYCRSKQHAEAELRMFRDTRHKYIFQ